MTHDMIKNGDKSSLQYYEHPIKLDFTVRHQLAMRQLFRIFARKSFYIFSMIDTDNSVYSS